MRALAAAAAALAGLRASGFGLRASENVLARIGGVIGEEARAAAKELEGARDARRLRAEWIAEARAPLPVGLRGVHGTWIEALLDGMPERARRVVAGEVTGPVDVWLARWVCAEVPSMPAASAGRPRMIEEVGVVGFPTSIEWLAAVGADQVAFVVASAGQAADAKLGEAIAAAGRRIGGAPRAGQLGPLRAAIGRCSAELRAAQSRAASPAPRGDGLTAARDDLALVRIGARALAPHLAERVSVRRQLVLRMPRPIGIVVERELIAHARAPFDEVPAWEALVG